MKTRSMLVLVVTLVFLGSWWRSSSIGRTETCREETAKPTRRRTRSSNSNDWWRCRQGWIYDHSDRETNLLNRLVLPSAVSS